MKQPRPTRILLVTGMSGAGKSTSLNTLEDLGWEVIDNLPLVLLNRLLATEAPEGMHDARPLAFGIDSRTRGFDAAAIVTRIKDIRRTGAQIATLFVDCAGAELERRYSETRRRHPLALDRPAPDGISRERELLAPLRRWADHVVDTTSFTTNQLKADIRDRFGGDDTQTTTISIMSFGFARGVPRNADLMFDVRFLRNPHWVADLRPLSGLDASVAEYVKGDQAYDDIIGKIEELLLTLLPRYQEEGKSYMTVAFGCTGGRHRSVFVAEEMAARLRAAGFSPTVTHRDLSSRPDDSTEGRRGFDDSDGMMEQR